MAHVKLSTALAGRGKTVLVFMSLEPGNHFNTAVKDKAAVKRIIESHCKANNLTLETTKAIEKIDRWFSGLSKSQKYSDLWIGFSNDSWITLTFNPKVQPLFCIEMAPVQSWRNYNLMRDGVPNWVRCYDYLHPTRAHSRPPGTKHRYTICFVGVYRSVQKKKGQPQSGYWTMQTAEDPKDYLRIWENDKIFDHTYGPYSIQVGNASQALGKRIEFKDLPPAVKLVVLKKYHEIWTIEDVRKTTASGRPRWLVKKKAGRKKKTND